VGYESLKRDEDGASLACPDASSYGSKEACPSCKDEAYPFL